MLLRACGAALRRHAGSPRARPRARVQLVPLRRAALLVAAIAIAVAFLAFRPAPTPGPALRDFEAYYAAGATWRLDGDPYSRDIWRVERRVPGVVATRDELLPFVGPPFSLALWGFFGALPYERAVIVWSVVLACAAVVLGACTIRLAGIGRALDVVAVALLGASFGPLTSALALGQAALVAIAGVVATTLLLDIRRVRLVAAIATACVGALQPNMALALVARLGDRRTAFAFIGAAGVVVALSLSTMGGPAGLAHYVSILGAHARAERTIVIQVTVAAIAFGFGVSERFAGFVGSGVALAVIGATVWILCARIYEPAARVAVACAALPLVLPFSHEHDLAIVFFPAVWAARRARGAWSVAVTCATVAVAVDWLGLAQRPSGIGQSIALALAAGLCSALLTGARSAAAMFAVPLATTLAVAGIAALAVHFPVPVWPYGLEAAFRVSPLLDATSVWALEQTRTGLTAPHAASAALRALSLAGCALLWIAALAVLPNARRARNAAVSATR